MKNYSFAGEFLDLDAKIIPDIPKKSRFMSNLLASAIDKDVDVIKYFDWAQRIRQAEWISLDASSVEELKKFIKSYPGLTVLVRRELLTCLEVAMSAEPINSQPQ
jgi:hypothetical protein